MTRPSYAPSIVASLIGEFPHVIGVGLIVFGISAPAVAYLLSAPVEIMIAVCGMGGALISRGITRYRIYEAEVAKQECRRQEDELKELRTAIAVMAMRQLLDRGKPDGPRDLADAAVAYSEALIEKLKRAEQTNRVSAAMTDLGAATAAVVAMEQFKAR